MLTANQLRLHRLIFLLSALYNVAWGVFVILFPYTGLRQLGIDNPQDIAVLFAQCIGMFVLTYAIGYLFLALNPIRYAPFAAVALLGKILGPIGWVWAWRTEQLPFQSGLTIITNDLIWWIPYGLFVYKVMIAGRNRYPADVIEPASKEVPSDVKAFVEKPALETETPTELPLSDSLKNKPVEVTPVETPKPKEVPAVEAIRKPAATPTPAREPGQQPRPAQMAGATGAPKPAAPRPAATSPSTLTSAGAQTAASRPATRPASTGTPAAGTPAPRPVAPRPAPPAKPATPVAPSDDLQA